MTLVFEQNVSLVPYSTFRLEAIARYLTNIDSVTQLTELVQDEYFLQYPHQFVGGGSNLVFATDFEGVIIVNRLKGIHVTNTTQTHVTIRAMAGEPWQALVDFALANNYGGIENLTLIPGTVGACPVQNIGAYGQEVGHTIIGVQYVDCTTGIEHTLTPAQCQFGYRTSIFKTTLRENACITSVDFCLSLTPIPNLSYQPVADQFVGHFADVTIQEVSAAIAYIRTKKLPDSQLVANCGSFFKNPAVAPHIYSQLVTKYPDIPGFGTQDETIKIPAAWLIEHAGWKDKRIGNIGTYPTQPLVLVNYGGARAEELFEFVDALQDEIFAKFGIFLETEVNIVRA